MSRLIGPPPALADAKTNAAQVIEFSNLPVVVIFVSSR
jgi:hypothetical protein